MPLETYIYFLVLGFLGALMLRNHHDRINLLKKMVDIEQRQRIAFELFQMARQYHTEHKNWPVSVHSLGVMMEYDGPNRVDPLGWSLSVSADTEHGCWTVSVKYAPANFERIFAVD